ncbi:MAG: SPOR domain-containing protein [Bryobacteraceae bacterium]|jgi:cell division protein FtsN
MRNKETGEFELVVGDRQLLSGFFIGVLLLAVVFAMGYVLGQNSPRSPKLATEPVATNTGAPNRPQPASPPEPKPDTTAVATPPGDAQAGANTAADTPPQPTTQPARDPSAPAASQPATVPPVSAPVSEAESDPPNASYLQVTAQASRSSAEAVMKTLRESGFPAVLRAGPNNLTAVWVGPFTDRKPLAEAKGKLEKAGFNPIVKKP